MDEDDYIASVNWDEFERDVLGAKQQSGSAPALGAQDLVRFANSQPQVGQQTTPIQWNAQLHAAAAAADLLKATLPNHPSNLHVLAHHDSNLQQHACQLQRSHQQSALHSEQQQRPQTYHAGQPDAGNCYGTQVWGPGVPTWQQQQQQRSHWQPGIQHQGRWHLQQQQCHWQPQQHWPQQQQCWQPQQQGWQQQQQQQQQQTQQQHRSRPHVSNQQEGPPHTIPGQQRHLHRHQQYHAPKAAGGNHLPRCPYKMCPGVFSTCGATLHWRDLGGGSGFWGCTLYPECDYRYFPAQQLQRPELGCEVLDDSTFRLVPQPAAEVAVARAGGIRAVLAAAGIKLDHLELLQQQQQQQHAPQAAGQLQSAAVDAESSKTAASVEPALAAAPDWSWPPELCMVFRLSDYSLVLAVLHTTKPALLGRGGAIPPSTISIFSDPSSCQAPQAEVEARFASMPASLRAALLPFQCDGVKYGLARHGRVLIADEMGVGKTVQALALAACYQDEWPLLVIVPASLRLVWAEEVERWLPHVRPGEVVVIEGKEDRLCDLPDVGRRAKLPAVTITSYEMMKRLTCPSCQKLAGHCGGSAGSGRGRGRSNGRGRGRGGGSSGTGRAGASTGAAAVNNSEDCASASHGNMGCLDPQTGGKRSPNCTGPDHCMAALPWGVIIIDESHNLRTTNTRNNDSPHTEAAVAAGAAAGRLVLLSGTPSLSRPYDLYRQVDVLVPGLLGNTKEEFAHRYCDRRLVPVGGSRVEGRLHWDNRGGCRLTELHGLLVRRVMIRRLKRDVMEQLPPKRRQVVRLPYPPPNRWPKEQEPGVQRENVGAPDDAAAVAAAATTRPASAAAAAALATPGTTDSLDTAGYMSAAHRTALAKLPDAIDWLMAALGAEAGSSGSADSSDKAAAAAAGPGNDAARKGPLKPAWKSKSTKSTAAAVAAGAKRSAAAAVGAAAESRSAKRRAGSGSSSGGGDGVSGGSIGAAHEDENNDDDGVEAEQQGCSSGSSNGPKFLVFAHHRDVMDKLAAALAGYGCNHPINSSCSHPGEVEAAAGDYCSSSTAALRRHWQGVGYVRIDGSHDSTERLAAVRKFKSDPNIRVALLSITAAAVGLDFSAASMVVFVELPHEVSLVRQAEDRAHRKGQAAKAVNVYFLCAQGTVDDKRWQALNTSLSHISQVHDGQAEMLPQPLAAPAGSTSQASQEAEQLTQQQQQQSIQGEWKHKHQAQLQLQQEGDMPAATLLKSSSQQQQCQGSGQQLQKLPQHVQQEGVLSQSEEEEEQGHATVTSVEAAAAAAADQQQLEQAFEMLPKLGVSDQQQQQYSQPDLHDTAQARTHSVDSRPMIDLTGDSPAKLQCRDRVPKYASPHRRPLVLSPGQALRAAAGVAAAAAVAGKCPAAARGASKLQSPVQDSTAPAVCALAGPAGEVDPAEEELGPPDVWFEVSGHTNRLHYHLAPDGTKPLGLNLPLDWLLLPEDGTLKQLADVWHKAWQQQQQEQQQQQLPAQQAMQQHEQQAQDEALPHQAQQQWSQQPGLQTQQQPGLQLQQQGRQQLGMGLISHQERLPLSKQQQAGTTSPVLQHAMPVAVTPAQQQKQGALPTPAAGTALQRSSNTRGQAKPALNSLLLPFLSPAATLTVNATPSTAPRSSSSAAAGGTQRAIGSRQQHGAKAPDVLDRLSPAATAAAVSAAECTIKAAAVSNNRPTAAEEVTLNVFTAAAAECAGSSPELTSKKLWHQSQMHREQQQEQQEHLQEQPQLLPFGNQGVTVVAATPAAGQKVQPLPADHQQQQADGEKGQQGEQQQQLEQLEENEQVLVVPDSQEQDEGPPRQLLLCSQEKQQHCTNGISSQYQAVALLSSTPQLQQAAAAAAAPIGVPAVNASGTSPASLSAAAAVHLVASACHLTRDNEAAARTLPPAATPTYASLPDCRCAPGFLGPSGLACMTLQLTAGQLLELLRMGADFAADWQELRIITRNRLAGKVVPPDLSAAVAAVNDAAANAGAHGVSTVRYARDVQEGDPCLPPGSKLVEVTVHYPQARNQLATYKQAFTGPTTRHCCSCFKAVEGCSLPQDAVLEGGLDLFCSLDCERLFFTMGSSSGIRRALFKLERGICQQCGLDCHALVQQLQQITKDTPHWHAQRRAVVTALAPRFLTRGSTAYLDKLLDQATEGNAWHADHILAVYEGGGGCDLENLRTLCVPCHAAVTKEQAKQRAEERLRRKLHTHDIRTYFAGPTQEQAAGMKRSRRAKAAAGRVFVDDLTTPEAVHKAKTTKRTAGKHADVTVAATAPAPAGEGARGTSKKKAVAASKAGRSAAAGSGYHASKPEGLIAWALGSAPNGHNDKAKAATGVDTDLTADDIDVAGLPGSQVSVEVISLKSDSPSLSPCNRATAKRADETGLAVQARAAVGSLQAQASTPCSSQLQPSRAATMAVKEAPDSAVRTARAAATQAATANAVSSGIGLLSVLDQFRYGSQSSQGEGVQPSPQTEQQQQQQQQCNKRWRQLRQQQVEDDSQHDAEEDSEGCKLAAPGAVGKQKARLRRAGEHSEQLITAEIMQLSAAANANAAVNGAHNLTEMGGGLGQQQQNGGLQVVGAVAGAGASGHGSSSSSAAGGQQTVLRGGGGSSRRAAHAAAAALQRQLADELSDADEGSGTPAAAVQQQASCSTAAAAAAGPAGTTETCTSGAGTAAGPCMPRSRLTKENAGNGLLLASKQQQPAKRARGAKRVRSHLDS